MTRDHFRRHEIGVHRRRGRWLASVDGKGLGVRFESRQEAVDAAVVEATLVELTRKTRRSARLPGEAGRTR